MTVDHHQHHANHHHHTNPLLNHLHYKDDLLDGISQQLGGLHERAKQIHTEVGTQTFSLDPLLPPRPLK